jgi:ABC-type lipoprotein export system ATPase subunit
MKIEILNLTKHYPNNPNPILDEISLSIAEGSTIAILGPSGSGKSTLLNILGTLDFPDSGEVLLNGTATSVMTKPELETIRNRHIGFVFQSHFLLPQLTALENIMLPALPRDPDFKKLVPERAKQLLTEVGLLDKKDSLPGEMSVGECQRIALVRALINEPEIVLADEPTGSLDQNSAEKLMDMIMKLRQTHPFTLVAVTHSPDLVKRAEIAYKLVNGKIFRS